LAKEKDTALWKASAVMNQGDILALVGRVSDAVPMIISGIAAYQLTGSTVYADRARKARRFGDERRRATIGFDAALEIG
jgi:hypothetical protein